MSDAYVVGDVHGHLARLVDLLQDAGLIDHDQHWSGGRHTLWFIGDLVDHGSDGMGVIDLVMRLQQEAAASGGKVDALLGNHDMLFLAVARFGSTPSSEPGGTFHAGWLCNGGDPRDLARLTREHTSWLSARPAMARAGDALLIHADAWLYARYGRSIADVNQAFADLLQSDDEDHWDRVLAQFGQHRAFIGERGETRAAALLNRFGGTRIVHGHSPINSITEVPAEEIREPLVYAHGQCVDVDGGIYLGGPGFMYRLSPR